MSIFKDSGIVLKIKKEQKYFLYTIFSQKFGKIIVNKKLTQKEKNIDLGFLINYELKVLEKNNISKIKNIKIINEFKPKNKNFKIINNYLILLKLILEKSAFGVENQNIIEIITQINKYKKNNFNLKIILANLKVLNIFGELDIRDKNITIAKILKFISQNNFKKIIKLSDINNEIEIKLEKIIQKKINTKK